MDLGVAQETKTGKTRLVSQMMLTDKNIDLLAKAFLNNICSVEPNATIEAARNAILASYYHASSSDANPTHDLCPPGEKSWCWVQRAKFRNEVVESHSKKTRYLFKLDAAMCEKVLLVYRDLTTTRSFTAVHQTVNSECQ